MTGHIFSDRTILITGGSRGIGRAASLRLAVEGARVAVNYVSDETKAEETVGEITAAGGRAIAIQGNVAVPAEAASIAEKTRAAFGPVDMLVHSAGISIVEHATDVTWETWRRTMDVNLDGTFNMVYALKDEMIRREFGRIVLLSSIAALRERENQVHYSASKAAVIAMTRCMAQGWAKHNIRINCICPGLIETEMAYTLAPEVHEAIVKATPMGRKGEPHEIASVIRFLLSDESSFMTGQTVVASGGRVMIPG
ncbi:MAG: 3-oxoacyl-ACP reductase FabG [Fuerstiella sp.]|nr:3-oxoacyl-ACP reductase FabG [Fuerstiella sp.]MCP4510499.1 3-oxoacyl-ACP reductase FabG [Fuerstiella sp.]